jgi:predicted dehydrogenase
VSDPLAIGLIGAGPWARMLTGPVLAAGPQTRVAGVWSRTPDHAAELAAQLDVPVFDEVEALFDACKAVAIAVTPAAQPELAVRAARAGKALLLEKPLADDVAGARSVADAVRETGVGALVMLTYRFNPGLAPFLAECARIEPLGGRGCFISGAFLGGPFAHGWRLVRGAVLDVGPHLLDLLEAALGEIVAVRASGDPLGWTSIICTHASGATSDASICCSSATDSRTSVEIYGREGAATYDGRARDFPALTDQLRRDFVEVVRGATHPANVDRALHLQELIADIESQLSLGTLAPRREP